MTEAQQDPDDDQHPAEEGTPERHRAPTEGIPQDLPDDADAEDGHAT